MRYAHLVVRRDALGDEEILLAQRNVFLPPNARYQFAAIARHATQYIVPGGRIAPGESALHAALREFYEDSDVPLAPADTQPLCVAGEHAFFVAAAPRELELGRINAALARGAARSAKSNNLTWVSIDSAASWLGMKPEYQHLPWVTEQIARALAAGFRREHLAPRVTDAHAPFAQAIDVLRGTGGTIGLSRVQLSDGDR
ncbi:MAG TPA: NUDIX hydrolase [Polyangia bacterium]|nr:NUDIX hydrolase [Polyangia bacterium]